MHTRIKKLFTKQKFHLIFIALCIVLTFNSCVFYRTALEAEYRKQADEAYEEENYTEALDYYKKTRFVTLSNSARFRVAEIEIKLREFERARKRINFLKVIDRKNILVKELEAYWYFATGDVETSIELYNKILAKQPYNTRILNNLGVIYFNEEKYQESLEMFNKSLEIGSLPISVLGNYFSALTSIPIEEGEDQKKYEEQKKTKISEATRKFIAEYEKEESKITLEELFSLTDILKNLPYKDFEYSVYRFIGDLELPDDKEQVRLIAQANIEIAELIFSKSYEPLEVDSLAVAFESLEKGIHLGFGNVKEEYDRLDKIRKEYITTNVQMEKILRLYLKERVITKAEFDSGMKEMVGQSTKDETQVSP